MKKLNIEPYLFFGGRCEEALEFYKSALGAEVEYLMRFKESPEPSAPGMAPDDWDDECGYKLKPLEAELFPGVLGHVRALFRGDMSPGSKAASCRRTPKIRDLNGGLNYASCQNSD